MLNVWLSVRMVSQKKNTMLSLLEITDEWIKWQEEVGFDVLVHGEFERNDMVEYFG